MTELIIKYAEPSAEMDRVVIPSEVVGELVRCKDCKWYKPNQLVPVHPLLGGGIVYENHCDVNFGFAPKENDFCSRGERREE